MIRFEASRDVRPPVVGSLVEQAKLWGPIRFESDQSGCDSRVKKICGVRFGARFQTSLFRGRQRRQHQSPLSAPPRQHTPRRNMCVWPFSEVWLESPPPSPRTKTKQLSATRTARDVHSTTRHKHKTIVHRHYRSVSRCSLTLAVPSTPVTSSSPAYAQKLFNW